MVLGKRKGKAKFSRTSAKRRKAYSTAAFVYRKGKSSYNARTGGYLGIENKFIDYSYPSTALVATNTGAEADPATALSISVMAQGDGESNRDGRKAVITSLHVKGSLTLGAAASSTLQAPVIARVALVLDTQSNGAQLNSEDVFLPATHVEFAYRNLQFTKRFKVVKDFMCVLNPMAAAGDGAANDTGAVTKNFVFNVSGLNMPTQYTSTTAIVGNVVDNSYHIVAFASNTTVSMKYESRCRFVG